MLLSCSTPIFPAAGAAVEQTLWAATSSVRARGQDRAAAGSGGIRGVRSPWQYLVNAPRPIDRGGQGQQGPALQQDAAHTALAAGDQHLSVGQAGLENHLGICKGNRSDL